MRSILVFVGLTFFYLNPLIADSILVQGEVSGNWDVDTVMVMDNIFINNGESLIIEAGCLIHFYGHYSLIVEGRIDAKGSGELPIRFTITDTLGFAYDSIPDGGWAGIRFPSPDQSNDSSVFEYCNFSFAKAVPFAMPAHGPRSTMDSCGGAINIFGFDKVKISHCRFENNFAAYNGGAIYLDSSNALIENCEFIDNRCGLAVEPWGYGGAICSDNAEPLIWNSYFEGNYSTGVGGGIAIRFMDGSIGNCIFTENHSALGGAFGFLHIEEINHRNSNNLIYNNGADFFGGAIANVNASPVYQNHTIVNNSAMYGGAFYCKDEVTPNLFNCILWANTAWSGFGPEVYLFEPYSQANFYFCDVEGGPELFDGSGGGAGFTGQFYESIDQDPQFQLTGDFHYELEPTSPGINTGVPDTTGMHFPAIDLAGKPRVLEGRIDMGAYESAVVGLHDVDDITEVDLFCYPNPTSDLLTISYTVKNPGIVKLELFDIFGRKIVTILDDFKNRGSYIDSFDTSSLPGGVYICLVTIGIQKGNSKIVKER